MTLKFEKRNKLYPIRSYGIVLFTKCDNELRFLLFERRDNFEYHDFLRGTWTTIDDVKYMLTLMNNEERNRLLAYDFSELWLDLWVSSNCYLYREGYFKAARKFKSINKRNQLRKLIGKTQSQIDNTPWGFPKGKRNKNESEIDCAMREFEEETTIPLTMDNIIDSKQFVEEFIGSDNKYYSTTYYLAYMNIPVYPDKIQTENCIRKYTISNEASNVGWFTYEECEKLLDKSKMDVLKTVYDLIQK